jgi:ubiquinone/menaquinone biosynthesis C-methylase UbiE
MVTVDFNRINISRGDTILDIGCGDGRHAGDLAQMNGITIVASDMNIQDLIQIQNRMEYLEELEIRGDSNLSMIAADITSLPFEDACFDHVICAEVMEHIPDDMAAARELIRILKSGGNLIVSVPRFYPEKICWMLSEEYYSSDGGHIRIYTQQQITAIFEDLGLRQCSSHFAHSLHTPYWWLKCLLGLKREDALPVTLYKRFLTWDILEKPWITRFTDSLLNPVLGKSLVVYFKKE